MNVMKRSTHLQLLISLLLMFAIVSPIAAVGLGDGKKHFKIGMKHEEAEEWDRASEEFAIAVSENPKNPEYRLHLYRALFNASQMYVIKGAMAAKENDFETAYVAYRRAYAFDPTNELAKSEMDRMVRLQREKVGGTDTTIDPNGAVIRTGYNANGAQDPPLPLKLEKLRNLPFPGGVDLQFIIKELARDLDLNVLFDIESFRTPNRKTSIDLVNVTAARALDYIFLQEGLFFQKVGPRTILVALQTQRQKFQQLVLRTFYLSNAAPKDIAKVVQTAIPAQPGRSQTIVLTDDATNSITIRDTEENIRLIGRLISSLDKDRAEVVMDVSIYEVSKSDLLKLGNQIGGINGIGSGAVNQLNNLGGINSGAVKINGDFAAGLATSIASGVLLPSSVISAFQSKGNTKLIASTQIHAFNNEDSSARIGQRVPVQSAQFVTGTGTTPGNGGVVSNVINYEQVGLTLKFKPLVFPNQDVQVAMEIESKDVAASTNEFIPIFTERTIKGTARIQNNKTLLLASVAQGSERNSRSGLPFLGWLPIIGRLFSTPTKDNSQVDIVIAVTPRVIRAPAIFPEDEVERPTGSLAVPTQSSLEAMIIEEERDELLAAARRIPTQNQIVLPDRTMDAPAYVPATVQPSQAETVSQNGSSSPKLVPIGSTADTLKLKQTANFVGGGDAPAMQPLNTKAAGPTAEIYIDNGAVEMKAGELRKIAVKINGGTKFKSAVVGMNYDSRTVAVRNVSFGDVFGESAGTVATPFMNQNGKMYISLVSPGETNADQAGTLLYIEIEALVDGVPTLDFESNVLNLLTADGKNFVVKIR